ncbi:MAG: hypothetical protein LBH43_19160 [Treponema sp.]|jgi:hypothetical protein|nr:hypothetical protein [Treponema sp.]
MDSAGKIASLGLLFALVFISPLCAQVLVDDPLAGEEPFSSEGYLSGEEFFPIEEPLPNEEPFPGEELLISEEPISDEELSLYEDVLIFEAPLFIFEAPRITELRSFDEIFSNFSQNQKRRAMSDGGLRFAFEKDGSPMLIPDPDSGVDLFSNVMRKKPSHVIESLAVVPYNEKELDILDIYNALRPIKNIKNHTIPSNGKDFIVFAETTRLESAKNRKPIPDPSPADTLPYSETMYLRFKDPYIGDINIRGDVSISLYGITYSLTNFTDIWFSFFRVMAAERFTISIYLEPVKEGVLIYSMSGLYLPNFVAKRINLTSNMNYRITALLGWITEGLRGQESTAAEQKNEALETIDGRQDNRFLRILDKE